MGKRENFTAERVASFRCHLGKQQSIYWDAKAPGLGLRVTASGAKSYIFETSLHGRTIRLTIGDVRTWALDGPAGKTSTARAEATRLKALTDRGIDPRQDKVERRAQADAARVEARRTVLTVGDVWPAYLEARKAKWSERHYQDHVRLASLGGVERRRGAGVTVPGPLSALLTVPLRDLTGERIAQWLDAESASRPTNAAQSYRLLRAFLRWLEDQLQYRGLVPADAYRARAVMDALPKGAPKDDCLQREQLKLWFGVITQIRNPVISVYLQSLLLTGARREEMAWLRWDDVDFQWRGLTIRDKVSGTRTIPLPPYLASLLAALPRRNEWVFSSPAAASGRLAEPRIAHVRALNEAGLPHLSLHGLRRSFGTLCEWVEAPVGVVAQIQGHAPSAIAEKHYRRRPLDLLRVWHDKIEAWMLEQAGMQFDPAQARGALRVVAG